MPNVESGYKYYKRYKLLLDNFTSEHDSDELYKLTGIRKPVLYKMLSVLLNDGVIEISRVYIKGTTKMRVYRLRNVPKEII